MMNEAGIRPEIICAFEKTGRSVTQNNQRHLSNEELLEWEAGHRRVLYEEPSIGVKQAIGVERDTCRLANATPVGRRAPFRGSSMRIPSLSPGTPHR